MNHDRDISPFETRYASKEMQYIFSEDNKFKTWRRLWIALAKAEQAQGLAITTSRSPSSRPTRTTSTTTWPSPARRSAATT